MPVLSQSSAGDTAGNLGPVWAGDASSTQGGSGSPAACAGRRQPDAPLPSVLVGLIGSGIQASRTPALHEQEGAAQGLRYVYKLIDLEAQGLNLDVLPDVLTAARRMGFAGLNITHPCKQAVIPLLDDLSPDARAIGAVNTVVLGGGRLTGHNTDWWGWAESFRREMPGAKLDHVVQLGAGGAGAAVAHAALTLGAGRIEIFDIDEERARRLARDLNTRFGAGRAFASQKLAHAMGCADGIVNTTPVGMAQYPGTPVPPDLLRREMWVSDIIYFPLQTELLRAARQCGARRLGGGGMAVFQAVEAFRLFTGIAPDAERMLEHFATM